MPGAGGGEKEPALAEDSGAAVWEDVGDLEVMVATVVPHCECARCPRTVAYTRSMSRQILPREPAWRARP